MLAVAVTACAKGADTTGDSANGHPAAVQTVSGATIAAPRAGPAGEWSLPAGDYSNSRYSELDQITAANVKGLHAAWTFSTGVLRGHEGSPLVVGNTMYIVTPYPNVSYALDLATEGQPLKWKVRPENAQQAVGLACCDVVNRGASFDNGKIFYNLLDGHTVAIDAASGKLLWQTKMGDLSRGETMTMAPLAVKGKVIVGSSGGEMGVRGWVAAIDQATGKEVWRAYNVGPDADIKVGPRFKQFYKPADAGANAAQHSWPGDSWKQGGATVWGWISYDPVLNLVYHGTSNPGPWNGNQRPGDNQWSAAIIARDADTGEMVWAFQPTPHDIWDYDGVNENILVDLPMGGTTRKALVHFDRNGFAYTMDRATGEVLVAKPFVPMNWASEVSLKTGRPTMNPDKMPASGKKITFICPSLEGGKNQQPAAFSPATGLFYVPTNNLCMDFEAREVTYIAGTPYIGGNAPEVAGPGGYKGEFIAWDATTGRKMWGIKEPFPVWGGGLATKGDVVFYGTLDGWFKAANARTGEVLWKFKVGSGVVGNPISYLGPDGKQYIAIYAGIGGDMGLLIAGDVAANLPFDVRERGSTLPDLARWTSWGGMLFVFSLN
ncbi:MAG: PQQ-dependent dehydrogenase, methanol/ethanol family [Gemmatimonadetes bacterium]|nr:PQQ-dependent dehydrogenase, methanol/ethanol family [Gemmatimonadota bacterium]